MISNKIEVEFCVRAVVNPEESVCIIGSCDELGSWDSQAVKRMRQLSRDLWKFEVKVPKNILIQYRYCKAILQQGDGDGDGADVIIRSWETFREPRFVDTIGGDSDEISVYGECGELRSVDRGWLTNQTEIQLRLHSNPLRMWHRRDQLRTYRVLCSAMDMRFKSQAGCSDDDDCEMMTPSSSHNVHVFVIDGHRNTLASQMHCGTPYVEDCFMVFSVQTFEPELLGFQFDFFIDDPNLSETSRDYRHIGVAYLLPPNQNVSIFTKYIPINGHRLKPIGEFVVDVMSVKPLPIATFDMELTWSRYWNKTRPAIDVGHRGMGSSYKSGVTCATVRENTIYSLSEAGCHGADYVEFDVQLTKDLIPVIYHDYHILLSIKKKDDVTEMLDAQVSDLSHEQLQQLKLLHKSQQELTPKNSECSPMRDPIETQPFPTLQHCFEMLDADIGFNIEIKHPQRMKSGGMEDGAHCTIDENKYIDVILSTVVNYGGSRRIIFSTFDADICVMIRLKQNRWPTLFLSNCESEKYPPYADPRTHSMRNAINFADSVQILGVNLNAGVLLNNPDIIEEARKFALIVFTWGEENNAVRVIQELKSKGVSGVIYDQINELKTKKENVFKCESKMLVSELPDKVHRAGLSTLVPQLSVC